MQRYTPPRSYTVTRRTPPTVAAAPYVARAAATPTASIAREHAAHHAVSGGVARWVAAQTATAALVVTAAAELWSYELSTRWRGPSVPRAVAILGRWSRRAWHWLKLEVRVHGALPQAPCLYVANHRSYLDIPLLAGVLDASFMSRADVATWPVIGAAARAVGSVFVERDDPHGRARAARTLMRRLGTVNVVVFPEGTTGAARLPGPFHLGLFRLLHRLDVRVVPVTIRYGDRRAYWTDNITLGRHLRRLVVGWPQLAAAVHVADALEVGRFADGEVLARAAYAAVCQPIEELGELVVGGSTICAVPITSPRQERDVDE